jgi:uncharacterized protein (TIGR02284 family)
MTETNSKIRSVLNGLIETCKDGQEGFRVAAENVDDGDIKRTLHEYSLQRAKFASELQAVNLQRGESEPEDSSSVAGAIHRGWMNLKTVIAGKDRYGILAECEVGEDSAVKEYREALELDLPADIRAVVNRQNTDVKGAHDRVKALRDEAKK